MSRTKRNATVVAGQASHLWKLDIEHWDRLEEEKPEIAREFTRILLRSESRRHCIFFGGKDCEKEHKLTLFFVCLVPSVTAEESDVLSAHLLAVLS